MHHNDTPDKTTRRYKFRHILFSETQAMLERRRYRLEAEAAAHRLLALAGHSWYIEQFR